MFTLRKITGDGVEMNFYLGKSYTLILQEKNPKEFQDMRQHLGYEPGETFGFISGDDGQVLGLFPKQSNYIMVGGKTVDYLSKPSSAPGTLEEEKKPFNKTTE